MKNYAEEELEDFIESVERVNQQVKDIIDGKVDVEQIQKDEEDQEKLKKIKKEIKEREKDEVLKKGRPGKGHQKGYKRFCKFCFTEYMIDLVKCTHCGKPTMTEEERYEELKEKLEEYKVKNARKKERRAKWENYVKTQALIYRKASTNYKKWDYYESSEETPDEDADPILPRNDPNFKAMESEMLDRRKRRQRDKKEAEQFKEKGNEALKRGLYKTAQKHYSDGIELKKDYLALYTNRALTRLKLEDYPGVIDDSTRVLEYCEVFHEGYKREKDLCLKALLRRCQALRAQKDYELALKDLDEAEKLSAGEKEVEKLRTVTLEDIQLEKTIRNIMANADSLQGKEYIDFILTFLQGRSQDQPPPDSKVKKFCYFEIKEEEIKKLEDALIINGKTENKDMIYYFNVKDGMKTLVDSLQFNTNALNLIQKLLDNDNKLIEDFQKQKLYEQLIDFLYQQNQNTEGKNLEPAKIQQILEILESASMNEQVRTVLSEKKKIKDLFLVVIRSVQVIETRKLLSSLIQFVSNLCYGTGKFRQMLRSENPQEFIRTIRQIYQSTDNEEADKTKNGDRILLRHAVLAFTANLCVDPQLRAHIASNTEQLLQSIFAGFEKTVNTKGFMWQEQVTRELGVLINVSIEANGVNYLVSNNAVFITERLITGLQYKGDDIEITNRTINLISKLAKIPEGCIGVASSKNILLRVLLYFNRKYPDLLYNCLRIFHATCKTEKFREVCLESHGFQKTSFDQYISEVQEMFKENNETNNQENLINCCSSVSAFADVFPERMSEFSGMIVPLINIVKEKTDLLRKNAAVCLAKLSKDEVNGKIMRENHGTEVLVSLSSFLK